LLRYNHAAPVPVLLTLHCAGRERFCGCACVAGAGKTCGCDARDIACIVLHAARLFWPFNCNRYTIQLQLLHNSTAIVTHLQLVAFGFTLGQVCGGGRGGSYPTAPAKISQHSSLPPDILFSIHVNTNDHFTPIIPSHPSSLQHSASSHAVQAIKFQQLLAATTPPQPSPHRSTPPQPPPITRTHATPPLEQPPPSAPRPTHTKSRSMSPGNNTINSSHSYNASGSSYPFPAPLSSSGPSPHPPRLNVSVSDIERKLRHATEVCVSACVCVHACVSFTSDALCVTHHPGLRTLCPPPPCPAAAAGVRRVARVQHGA
jgi:hypothetical protein